MVYKSQVLDTSLGFHYFFMKASLSYVINHLSCLSFASLICSALNTEPNRVEEKVFFFSSLQGHAASKHQDTNIG